MLITATQKYTRQSPRKVRLVANAVKKLSLEAALKQLAIMDKRASVVVIKTVRQAIANAMNNHRYLFADLAIADIRVGEGPKFKRFQAVSRGRAHSIIKRSSHITVVLKTAEGQKPEAAVAKIKKPEVVKEVSKSVQQKADKNLAKAVTKVKQPKVVTKKTVNRTTHK
jgi:large subunit ribosomal protein L22